MSFLELSHDTLRGIQLTSPFSKRDNYSFSLNRFIRGVSPSFIFRSEIWMKADKTEFMCFKPDGDIPTLNGQPIRLIDLFTYLGSKLAHQAHIATKWVVQHRPAGLEPRLVPDLPLP